jgi:hypothetical protein
MNNIQIQKTNMIDASLVVLNENKPVWQANATFSGAVDNIQSSMGLLNTADTIRLALTLPLTETKGQAKVALIAATMLHAAAGLGYGSNTGNVALQATCDIAESYLVKQPDAELGNACMIIYNAVQPFIGSMAAWSVDVASLAVLESDITTFNGLVGTPAGQISIKAAAGARIDTQLDTIDGILHTVVDTLMLQFKTTHADFYNAYSSARKIHHTGVHHSVIFEGFIYDANGNALLHAEVILSLNAKTLRKHFTDESGKYRFTRLHTGTYVMQITAPGFVTQSKTFSITVLQTVETNFTMHVAGGSVVITPPSN